MLDFAIAAFVVLIVSLAALYLRREKKKGAHCAGCPYAGNCQDRNK